MVKKLCQAKRLMRIKIKRKSPKSQQTQPRLEITPGDGFISALANRFAGF
jgi:hypothetical protein